MKAARRRAPAALLAAIDLDRSSSEPLHRQLYRRLRELILGGQFLAGTRLPSTRALAADLKISRSTAVLAYEQLGWEGYTSGRLGAGTVVAVGAPASDAEPRRHRVNAQAGPSRLSGRGERAARAPFSSTGEPVVRMATPPPFPGHPALDEFPLDVWTRLLARRARGMRADLLGYQSPAGFQPLRDAIAAYLGVSRGVTCTSDQVIVLTGSQEGLSLCAQMLLDPGDRVWIEDPGYLGARAALVNAGAELIPVPVDDEGIDLAAGIAAAPDARLVYVTPANQCPLGATMSAKRRLALLEWARATGAWIVEDDYDGEFRYAGSPVPALQSLDRDRVIYVGTFSKVMFPALRIGYLVPPLELLEAFTSARRFFFSLHSPVLEQAVLRDFMVEGHFGRHVRRMRSLYSSRRSALLEAIERHLSHFLEVVRSEGGMYLTATFRSTLDGVDDRRAARLAAANGVDVVPVSVFRLGATGPGGLLLGFAGDSVETIRDNTPRLRRALAQALLESGSGESFS